MLLLALNKPSYVEKNIFVLGSYESLDRLEGQIRSGYYTHDTISPSLYIFTAFQKTI